MRDQEFIAELTQQLVNQMQEATAAAQTQLAETVNGILLKGSRYVPLAGFTAAVTAGDHMLAHGPGQLVGAALRETGGVVVTVILHDGYDASGPEIYSARIAANQTQVGPLAGVGGVMFTVGLFVEVQGGGAVGGAVYLRGSD